MLPTCVTAKRERGTLAQCEVGIHMSSDAAFAAQCQSIITRRKGAQHDGKRRGTSSSCAYLPEQCHLLRLEHARCLHDPLSPEQHPGVRSHTWGTGICKQERSDAHRHTRGGSTRSPMTSNKGGGGLGQRPAPLHAASRSYCTADAASKADPTPSHRWYSHKMEQGGELAHTVHVDGPCLLRGSATKASSGSGQDGSCRRALRFGAPRLPNAVAHMHIRDTHDDPRHE